MWRNLMEKFEEISGGVWILIIIGLLCIIAFSVTGLGSKIIGKMDSTNKIIDNYSYAAYDEHNVAGNSVTAAIQSAETPNPNKINISVTTGTGVGANTTSYGYSSEADTTYTGYSITDPADDSFINPYGSFKASLIKNNGVVTGISFVQQ